MRIGNRRGVIVMPAPLRRLRKLVSAVAPMFRGVFGENQEPGVPPEVVRRAASYLNDVYLIFQSYR
jgi:hypothetical protein